MNLEFTVGKVVFTCILYQKLRETSFGCLLKKFGFKSVFESNQFVLTKLGAFVGNGYLYDSMFKLNLINKVVNSAYFIEMDWDPQQ